MFRFTPTCVGNTPWLYPSLKTLPVHPHLRGEYSLTQPSALAYVGSPPPAWGIRRGTPGAAGMGRFTPTCVGNTNRFKILSTAPTVHPHLRGEYSQIEVPGRLENGSPPPAWGIRQGGARSGRHGTVHPHLRGEYAGGIEPIRAKTGSPPPAWGIPPPRVGSWH